MDEDGTLLAILSAKRSVATNRDPAPAIQPDHHSVSDPGKHELVAERPHDVETSREIR